MRCGWRVLLGLLIMLGLNVRSVVQTQANTPQITGTLYYQRNAGLEREYVQLSQEGGEIIPESAIAGLGEHIDHSLPAPPLPELMRNLVLYPNGFYQKSPTSIYAYLRCPESQINYFYSENYRQKIEFCEEQHVVVFDAHANMQIIHLDVDQVPPHNGLAAIYSFVWSPTGRYLAYSTATCGNLSRETCPHIRIYDTVAHEYVDTSVTAQEGTFVFAAFDHALQWSPDERYFAFLQNPNVVSKRNVYITILDTTTNSITMSIPDQSGGASNWLWSPDSQSIVYLKPEGQLVRVNISSGSSELIDTNVTRIFAWNE